MLCQQQLNRRLISSLRYATGGLPRSMATVLTSTPPAQPSAHHPVSHATPATLHLTSGHAFKGTSFGATAPNSGEAVFTTSMVGYTESLTDPSYCGQILVFTQPMIGNYGVPGRERDTFGLLKNFESERSHVHGVIVSDLAWRYSHWKAVESLHDWMARENIPGVTGVDTRALVRVLREQGSTLADIEVDGQRVSEIYDPNVENLVAKVSVKEPYTVNPGGDVRVAVLDYGAKGNILRSLVERGACITVMPWNYPIQKYAHEYDGVFLSNGPGNPAAVVDAVTNLRELISAYQKPVFGICMGNQLMGLAAGVKTRKLRFGNRGHNQPALNLDTGRCVITSQNHGFAIDDTVMPSGWQRWYTNVNDRSNEGIRSSSGLFRSVQFHPEAKGGPLDSMHLFDEFLAMVRAEKIKSQGLTPDVEKESATIQVAEHGQRATAA